mgnify:CR=1 FL=1
MNNIFVYIENEGGKVADVCLELLTKGRELATTLGVKLEAVVLGEHLAGIETELAKYGADTVWVADDKIFAPFRTLPHTAVMCGLIEQEKPQIALFGATCNGRDFAPARIVGPLQRSYGRLHAAGDRRPQGRQDRQGV